MKKMIIKFKKIGPYLSQEWNAIELVQSKVNLIIGKNASGKSFLLDLINIISDLWSIKSTIDFSDKSASRALRIQKIRDDKIGNFNSEKNVSIYKKLFEKEYFKRLKLNYTKEYCIEQEIIFDDYKTCKAIFNVNRNSLKVKGYYKDGFKKQMKKFYDDESKFEDILFKEDFHSLFDEYKKQNNFEFLNIETIFSKYDHLDSLFLDENKFLFGNDNLYKNKHKEISEILSKNDKNFRNFIVNQKGEINKISYIFDGKEENIDYNDISTGTKKIFNLFSKLYSSDKKNSNTIYLLDEFTNYWQNDLSNQVLEKIIYLINKNKNKMIICTSNTIDFVYKLSKKLNIYSIKQNQIKKINQDEIKSSNNLTQKRINPYMD